MTQVTFIRHAEAEGNRYRRCHGQYDSLLTVTGHKQVAALAAKFSNTKFDRIYTSDLWRARCTAAALRAPENPVALTALREIHLGPWEDIPWGEIARTDPQRLILLLRDPDRLVLPGAEAMQDVKERVLSTLTAIVSHHPGQSVAVVSHAMALNGLIDALVKQSPHPLAPITHIQNAAVITGQFSDNGALCSLSYDNSHLSTIPSAQTKEWFSDPQNHIYFRPAVFPQDRALWAQGRRDAWDLIYGPDDVFSEGAFYKQAQEISKTCPQAVVFAYADDTPVGILELDTEQLLPGDGGHICFFYLFAHARGKGYAPQLLGHAVSLYRRLGRVYLHLRVAEHNTRARRFYERMGFSLFKKEYGGIGVLDVMQMKIKA